MRACGMAPRRFLLLVTAVACFGLCLAGGVSAQAPIDREHVNVLGVNGLIDSVVVDSIYDAVARAEREGALALVLQVDSTGAVVGRAHFDALLARLEATKVPIGVWVGPARASAEYAAHELLGPADLIGFAPGATVKPANHWLRQVPTLGDFIVSLDGVESRAGELSTAEVE